MARRLFLAYRLFGVQMLAYRLFGGQLLVYRLLRGDAFSLLGEVVPDLAKINIIGVVFFGPWHKIGG